MKIKLLTTPETTYELDAYEQEIFDALEAGTLKPIALERERFRKMAAETLTKTRRVNIRMTSMTLEGMQAKAAEEGLPYQTLMDSVLHKYASGAAGGWVISGYKASSHACRSRLIMMPQLRNQQRVLLHPIHHSMLFGNAA